MAGVIERRSGGGDKPLCFPITLPVACSQMPSIITVAGLNERSMVAIIKRDLQEEGDLFAIVTRETFNVANDTKMTTVPGMRRDLPFYPAAFFHGIYAVTRILFAQAQENREFLQSGFYPYITGDSFRKVKQQRSAREVEKELPLRARFIAERERLEQEQPTLAKVLNVITEGLELIGNRKTDFYGGAAFAYELFCNSNDAMSE